MNPGVKTISYAWVVVGLLWPVALLNYLDRQMLSTIRSSIRADIPDIASDEDFGKFMANFFRVLFGHGCWLMAARSRARTIWKN